MPEGMALGRTSISMELDLPNGRGVIIGNDAPQSSSTQFSKSTPG